MPYSTASSRRRVAPACYRNGGMDGTPASTNMADRPIITCETISTRVGHPRFLSLNFSLVRYVIAVLVPVTVVATGWLFPDTANGQPNSPPQDIDRFVEQLAESRRGYLLRIPKEAVLDSASSGWSPAGRSEQRTYIIPRCGLIRITVAIRSHTIPDTAVSNGPYVFTTRDSATSGGTGLVRTYYLPTRSVTIALIPTGIGMRPYLDAAAKILATFRWKPGAETNADETDPPPLLNPPGASDVPSSSLGGS